MTATLRFLVMVLLYGNIRIVGQTCTELSTASTVDLVKYLNRSKDSQKSLCVEYAIRHLGEKKSFEAILVILRYLDYRREPTQFEKQGIATSHGWYPATIALYEIGKPAMPFIVERLATEMTLVERRNALETIMDISSDDFVSAVKLIRSAAQKVKGDDVRITEAEVRLTEASREAARMCPPRVRPSCEAALYDMPSPKP